MSNFVGTLLSICKHFFLVFLKFLLILMLNKLVYSDIYPLGKTVMHRLKLSLLFATLRAISSLDIGSFVGIPHSFFGNFSLYSKVYINFHEYVNKSTGKYCH